MITRVLAGAGRIASLAAVAAVLQACATAPPPPGASAGGCWTSAQSWHGGGSPAQQPAPVRTWTNDPKACGKGQAPND